jgi:nucleotide-binding universal stress UspA family protein
VRQSDVLLEPDGGLLLLAVGGRSRHGAHGLGSVSESVAHDARCSVLVVREPNGAPGS